MALSGDSEKEVEKTDVAHKEEKILSFWKEHDIFQKSLKKEAPKGEFVFYDGPPFATGLPHPGSMLSSTAKDVFPRYKTMRGYRVRRRWGWDTHGLPIENLVEKELGLKNKKEILALGIGVFNEKARSMVLGYVEEWKRYVERIGRFVDFDNSYKTMDASFMESVWWALKRIHEKGNLYEGRKVLMYCPHCETPLAKAEIAMDNTYKDITEETATVKFKVVHPENHGLPQHTYLLAWTTTPWTLPGNVALAVGNDISYGLYEKEGTTLIAAADLAASLGLATTLPLRAGRELVGIQYEPLYEIGKVYAHQGKKWEVLSADFVTAEEGTGIVHTAVIYGEDDYQLGLSEGLPMVPLLNPNGTYNDDAPEFLRGQFYKKAEVLIQEDLEKRTLRFAHNQHTHSYPHCYRCGTALIYNAVSSWFINIQNIKERMLAENQNITWTPEHLKNGRFKKNLETAPDWTISRNRFWATPLPIWKNPKGEVTVVGSLGELKALSKKSGNTYFIMRHGQAENNVLAVCSTHLENQTDLHITRKGKEEATVSAKTLADKKIDYIFHSPFTRTHDTALVAAEVLGVPKEHVIMDERLREIDVGVFEGKPTADYRACFSSIEERFTKAPEGAETFADVAARAGAFLYELENKYKNENILIVSHGDVLWLSKYIAAGVSRSELETLSYPETAGVEQLNFVPLPHNKQFELDLHLPYIDEIELISETGEKLTRIPEVVDCWVESGAMPFAEHHYPFGNKHEFEKRAPADFISEYIGQTRAWFYYLHAISTALFDRPAFKNVVTTGTIVASDGQKLSKSKKNYTDPYALFEKYGADAFRYYLMSSVVMQAEDLTFRDDDVKEAHNRVVSMLRNVASFYELYKHEYDARMVPTASSNVLDQWILLRLNTLVKETTESFDRYDVIRATRPLRDFIDELSTWYTRRSRERVKGTNTVDKKYALATLHHVLKTMAHITAPVMPFLAEELFQSLRTEKDPESVHLADWPKVAPSPFFSLFGKAQQDNTLLQGMRDVRTYASEALMLRQKAGVKVRQPLASLSITGTLSPALADILKDELNVKEIIQNAPEMLLDTVLTPELIREGDVREFVRAISEARKIMNLSPKDMVHVAIEQQASVQLAGVHVPGVSAISFTGAPDALYEVTLSTGTAHFSVTHHAT